MMAAPLRDLDDLLRRAEPAYRRAFADDWARETARKVLATDRLVRRLDPTFRLAEARVLDVGCGMGRLAAMLGALGAGPLWGIDDFGDTAAGAAPHLDRLRALGVTPLVHDLTRAPWPLPDGGLDLVVSFNTLEHLPHGPSPVMAEIRRVLRPGGLCVLGLPNHLALYKRLYVLVGRTNNPRFDAWWTQVPWRGHVRETAPGELGQTLRRSGFTPTAEIGLDAELPERLGRAYPLYRAAVALAPHQLGEVLVCAGIRS